MTEYVFITFLPAVVNLGLGVYVWSRNPERRENRLLALGCLGLSIYCFRAFEVYTRPVEFAEMVFPVLTFGPLFAGAFLSDFLLVLARRPLLSRRGLEILLIYAPVTFFALGDIFTDWFFGGIEVADSGVYIALPGPLSDLSSLFLGALLVVAIVQALRSLFSSPDPDQKKRLLWSISGIGIGTLITLVFLFLPPSLLFTSAAEIVVIHVAFTTSLIAGTMVYAIARYSLAPSIEELRRREEQLRREKAEAQAREAELQRQVLDAQIREERRRQEELERELRTAHDLQMKLMPKESPRIAGLEMAGCCLPATHVGGDYFQYFHRDGRLSFCLADVTGHAMQAAIPVVMFSGILESQMELAAPVEELFGRLNRSLCRVLDRRTFVCFAMGELDLSTRLLRLSNGGCPYPYLFRAGTGQVCEVQLDAYPLGIRSDTSYRVEEIPLEEGDVVVLCSDGIIEAENNLGELFGFERTLGLIAGAPARSAESLLAHIVGAVRAFTGNAPLTDDMTCIVLRLVEKS